MKDESAPPQEDQTSGSSTPDPTDGPSQPGLPELPREVKKWNWGAMLLPVFWGPANGVPWGLLALFPGVGLVIGMVLGRRGGELAWQKGNWTDLAHFKKSQRRWAIAGFSIWITLIVGFTTLLISEQRSSQTFKTMSSPDGQWQAMVPGNWDEDPSLNPQGKAAIAASDTADLRYFLMFAIPREDYPEATLDQYAEARTKEFLKEAKGKVLSGPTHREIGGRPAVHYEIAGVFELSAIRIFYVVIEAKTHFLDTRAWTVSSELETGRPVLERIINSIR